MRLNPPPTHKPLSSSLTDHLLYLPTCLGDYILKWKKKKAESLNSSKIFFLSPMS